MVLFYNISLRAVFVARHNILPRNKKKYNCTEKNSRCYKIYIANDYTFVFH